MNVNSAFHMLAVVALDCVGCGHARIGEDLPFKLSQDGLQNKKLGAESKPGCQC